MIKYQLYSKLRKINVRKKKCFHDSLINERCLLRLLDFSVVEQF